MLKRIKKWGIIILLGNIVVSCAPTNEAAYLQEYTKVEDIDTPNNVYLIEQSDNDIIEKGDELYITVLSGNSEPNSFNQQAGAGASSITEILSYKVDEDGFITLPYLKRVKVAGKNINQIIEDLETQLSQYIYLPSVSIRIINNRVAILGEVNTPGMFLFNRNSLNIYQALALAGDVSTFGNRKKVLIVRKDDNQIQKKYIDLTNDQIINSKWYFIEPEDIIYVEPMSRKRFGMETFSIFSLVSLLTSTYLIYTIVQDLQGTQ